MSKNLVLWVENEPERLTNFQEDIEEDDTIELVIKKDAKSAVEYLRDNIEKLSGAVLDIESFIDPQHQVETKTSFCRVRDCINTLKHVNPIEYFAFTGKGKYLGDKENFREEYGCEIFDKNFQVFEAEEHLRKIVNRHIIARISNRYRDAFELSEDIQADLLQILIILESGNTKNANVYNIIRKVFDWIMAYCYEIGLSQVQFNGSNLAECSKFLGRAEMAELVPVYVQRCFHSAVTVANEGSHRLSIDKDTKDGACPYLIRSTIFELLTIINWLKQVTVETADIEARKAITKAILEAPQGEEVDFDDIVEQDERKNFHCGEYLLPFNNGPAVNTRIHVYVATANTSRTKDIYPYFATRFKKID